MRSDLTGQKFGELTALSFVDAPGDTKWMCLCECGKYKNVRVDALVSGRTKSCGCLVGRLKSSTGVVIVADGGSYCEIPLTQGLSAKVSPEDYLELSRCNWHAWWNKATQSFYAKRSLWVVKNGRHQTIYMHRVVLGLQSGGLRTHSDHINHDTLDNRRENLRSATPEQNVWNSKQKCCGNATGYRGVTKLPNGKFKCGVRVAPGRRIYSRQVDTPEEAYADYRRLVEKHHREFAYASA